MRQSFVATVAAVAVAVAGLVAAPRFVSVWKSPDVARLDFAGKKVAALVITGDQPLQVSGEEALARELSARGVMGVATYRVVPREEIKDAARVRPFFERAGIEGVVALRPVRREKNQVYAPVQWVSGYYPTLWGYYNYGWSNLYVMPTGRTTTTVVVETMVYDVARDRLVWAATTEAQDPKTLQALVADLVKGAVSEMRKEKFVN